MSGKNLADEVFRILSLGEIIERYEQHPRNNARYRTNFICSQRWHAISGGATGGKEFSFGVYYKLELKINSLQNVEKSNYLRLDNRPNFKF